MPKTFDECRSAHGRVWIATIEGLGEFVFRKPTSREWTDYDAARIALGTATQTGNITKSVTVEFLRESEDLVKRVFVSHTAEELQGVEDEFLGIFRDLAMQVSEVVDGLRAKSGKGSPPPGPT